MPLFILDEKLKFPPVDKAEPDGLLAMGGDLSPERIILAYQNGIFPWYEDETILWWCPDPRFVLYPDELKLSKTVKPLLNKNAFEFTINKAFEEVIYNCKEVFRSGQYGTWITDDVKNAYIQMHKLGYAHSAEVWQNGELVGGLYGIRMGKVFFGESMFSLVDNASRYCFAKYVAQLKKEDVQLIDCQQETDYLRSMGARLIPRKDFIQQVQNLLPK
ncbi:MAG: leucyl/phenylalanyl-tRNA--protein transferase [Bacteroidetes bacterium]|nr:leucyl/phenylalanyl-tRNA--protein transferase [Bacteroidota bacterium]